MFEGLQDRLERIIHKAKGYGKITEENISEMLREVRIALLEADVNYKVVKEFTNNVKEKALGSEVATSLKPGEVFVKIVNDELVELLGGEAKELNLKVAASGMNKQDYIIDSLLKRNIRIVGGRKVIREVQMQLEAILEELQFMDENTDIDEDVIMPLKVVLEVLTADEAKK